MVIAIFGESCVGKSTIAKVLSEQINAEVYAGKDYLRLAKNEAVAKELFQKKMQNAVDGKSLIYVISEREHLVLLPEKTFRVYVSADLKTIKERFAARMHGNLPIPVEKMLENKHGCFDHELHDIHIANADDAKAICKQILDAISVKGFARK